MPTTSLPGLGRDDGDPELVGGEAERLGAETLLARHPEVRRDGDAVDVGGRHHEETDGMDREQGARGEDGTLYALLATVGEEARQVGEVAELGLVHRALGADGQGRAELGDHDADLASRNLHPRVALDGEDGPELESQARHEQLGLIAGFAVEADGVVVLQAFEGEPLVDQTDLGRSDQDERLQSEDDRDESDHADQDEHGVPHVGFRARTRCRGSADQTSRLTFGGVMSTTPLLIEHPPGGAVKDFLFVRPQAGTGVSRSLR